MSNYSCYPRYELVHVSYDDGGTVSYLHKIEIDEFDDSENKEFIEKVISFPNYSDVLVIFSEYFRWNMKKMSVSEYEDVYIKSFSS